MQETTVVCHNCGESAAFEGRLTHEATCDRCSSYLRCCLNCHFHEPTAYNECREPQADRVKEKEKATFCEFFQAGSKAAIAKTDRRDEALRRLNDLFKK